MTVADYRRWATTPNQAKPELSVVIPTYNEEWRILPTIGAIASHVSSVGFDWELIVADDGSTDSTVDLVRSANLANVTVLVADQNRGKGSAVRRGMLQAQGHYILFADADQSTPIEQLDQLLNPIRNGSADITIGSRAADGSEVRGKSLIRHALSRGLNQIVHKALSLNINDTQCGFKLFTKTAAHRIFSVQQIDGFSFDLEVLHLAHKYRYRVMEVPVEWIDAPGSTVAPFKVAIRFLLDVFLIRWNDARHRDADTEFAPNVASSDATDSKAMNPKGISKELCT